MTAEQAAQTHPDAAQDAILVHRLEHVFRTSGAGTARRRQNAGKYGPAIRSPWLYALRKSEVLRMRALFGKPNLVGVPQGSFVANREFMAALGAAPREHGPPVLGAHAYPKSVGLGPFAVVWLKCAFWHWLSLGPGK